jgi:hypothetical protein
MRWWRPARDALQGGREEIRLRLRRSSGSITRSLGVEPTEMVKMPDNNNCPISE